MILRVLQESIKKQGVVYQDVQQRGDAPSFPFLKSARGHTKLCSPLMRVSSKLLNSGKKMRIVHDALFNERNRHHEYTELYFVRQAVNKRTMLA